MDLLQGLWEVSPISFVAAVIVGLGQCLHDLLAKNKWVTISLIILPFIICTSIGTFFWFFPHWTRETANSLIFLFIFLQSLILLSFVAIVIMVIKPVIDQAIKR